MTLSDKALTTLENVKLYLGIPANVTTYDDILIEMINIVSDELQNTLIKRDLGVEERTEYYSGSGTQFLNLDNYPITAIAEVKLNDEVITDYRSKDKSGILIRHHRWTESGYIGGLSEVIIEHTFNIEVTYTAGYVLPKDAGDPTPVRTLPYDIEGLCKRMVSEYYNTAGSEGLDGFSISDVSWDWSEKLNQKDMSIIETYKKVRI